MEFRLAMKRKLFHATVMGRSGWYDPEICTVEELREELCAHMLKTNPGNYVDIANLAMMLHYRTLPDVADLDKARSK